MKEQETIAVYGARAHNLKNIDLSFPRNKLVVFTGLSGSGKSSLAFDTIFAEGQRRYIETFSSYVRQFIGGLLLLSNKKRFLDPHVPRSEPLPNCMIFFGYCTLGQVPHIPWLLVSPWLNTPKEK